MENNKIHEIRLIVAGTRTFDDYVLMKEKLDRIILGLREDYSGAPVAFWDGKSRGTDNMIQAARRGKAFVRVIPYEAADVKKTERKP